MSLGTKGFDSNRKVLNALNRNIEAAKAQALDHTAAEIISEAKSNLQNKQHVITGELLGSVRVLSSTKDSRKIGTDKLQGTVVEKGRREVKPLKPGGVLVWIDPDSGDTVFAKKSKAVTADPWLEPAVRKHDGLAIEFFKARMRLIIRSNKDGG